MANRPKPQQPVNVSSQTRRRTAMVLWASVAVMGILIFSLPTVIIFAFGMLPSLVAYVIDRSKEKYAMFCVASFNFCGVFPYLMDLWFGDNSIYAATNIMANVFALVIMYGSAAIGWVIFSSVPPFISSFLSVIAQQRVNALREQQITLIKEWGEAVVRKPDAAIPAGKAASVKQNVRAARKSTPAPTVQHTKPDGSDGDDDDASSMAAA